MPFVVTPPPSCTPHCYCAPPLSLRPNTPTTPSGIIAEVRSADSRLKDAVGRNDSSLLSSDSLNLLRTTLNNWGHTIRNLGSANLTDDDDDDDNNESEVKSGSEKDAAKAGNGKPGEGDKDAAAAAEDAAAADTLQVWCVDCGVYNE